ncbi:hypothetical protein C823_007864 [Eubacterium plexicaudatum ASF492]|uniref:Uncharacterized protein n=1 Tax=Eubacterium plexicaudatum ASF492 TaxID=1235802 RepID=N2AA47_9FIRM|nr:hypothetical protein C823_007864 [Eubacterium plexicaudatum ASF492]
MKELYIEYKPCSKTIYKNGYPILPIFCTFKAHVVDGKCTHSELRITDDLKYIYLTYKLRPSFFRITNISSKPFITKDFNDKLRKYRQMARKIDEMKKEMKELLYS